MIKQTLFFASEVSLSLRNHQLLIQRKDSDEVITRPIEDIGVIVVENQQAKLTIPLLNELCENNVAVVFCNGRMMPQSMLMNLDSNHTQQEAYRQQVEASVPMQKKLWQQIVASKIRNQSTLLNKLGKNGGLLRPYYQNVLSGDTDNREGLASRIYWNELFGSGFRRQREGGNPNAMLNYGYSILRAAVTRALMGSGLFPAFGIFHRNRYNAFPLADDMMEPYRPFVDEIVFDLYANGNDVLENYVKQQLLGVLTADVRIGEVTRPLEIALQQTTASLRKVYSKESSMLSLPSFL